MLTRAACLLAVSLAAVRLWTPAIVTPAGRAFLTSATPSIFVALCFTLKLTTTDPASILMMMMRFAATFSKPPTSAANFARHSVPISLILVGKVQL